MAKIFKPRRALRSSVKSGSKRTLVLASGELMAVGKTAIGENSRADIYLGDGVSQIQNLQPALFGDTSEEDITITDDASTTATAALGNVTTGATLGSILGSLKRAISLNASAIATLNDDLKRTSVYYTIADGYLYFGYVKMWYVTLFTMSFTDVCPTSYYRSFGTSKTVCQYSDLVTLGFNIKAWGWGPTGVLRFIWWDSVNKGMWYSHIDRTSNAFTLGYQGSNPSSISKPNLDNFNVIV